jgi:hypothetical protein
MIETLGHGKYERDDFLITEILILKTLNFRIPKNYFIDFINCGLKYILPSINCIASRELYRQIKLSYKKSLFLNTERFNNILMTYTYIVYNTLTVMQDLITSMDPDVILANLSRLIRYYKLDIIIYRKRNLYLSNENDIVSGCKV